MYDAFDQKLNVGDTVVGICNLSTTQTLYLGTILSIVKDCAVIQIDKHSNVETNYSDLSLDEKRVCVSHRLAKI